MKYQKVLPQRRIVNIVVTMLFVVASTLLPFAVQSPAGAISNDPAALLQLDARQAASYPGSGTTWTDLTGQGKNATINGGATFSTNKFNFNGASNSFMTVPSGFADFTKGITVVANVDFGAANSWERIFDFGNGENNGNVFAARSGTSSDLAFGIAGQPTCNAPGGIASGMHEYKFVMDGLNCWIYRDSTLLTSPVYSYLPANVNRTSNFIGKSNWGADAIFEGSIQSVAIYNYSMLNLGTGTKCDQHINRSGSLNYGVTVVGNDCVVKFSYGSGTWMPPSV